MDNFRFLLVISLKNVARGCLSIVGTSFRQLCGVPRHQPWTKARTTMFACTPVASVTLNSNDWSPQLEAISVTRDDRLKVGTHDFTGALGCVEPQYSRCSPAERLRCRDSIGGHYHSAFPALS